MTEPAFLAPTPHWRLGYHSRAARGDGANLPGVMFLGGFRSDMGGTKALWLDAWAAARGRGFVRFDYRGHGVSSGAFEDGCIGDWFQDARLILSEVARGPQILVGSSMGGWIACLLARACPGRVAGLVGIAAAPDFTEDGMWAAMDAATRARLGAEGRVTVAGPYGDYVLTRRLIVEARARLVLRGPLAVPGPVRLLHGVEDAEVPVATALALLRHLDSPDAQAVLVKGGDHRLARPGDLALIGAALDAVTAAR